MNIDFSVFEEIESRYLSLYPYKENKMNKRIILMAETFTIFSTKDQDNFLNFLCDTQQYNLVDYESVVKLLFNSYFLAPEQTKRNFCNLLISLLPQDYAWKYILLAMTDYDFKMKSYVETLLEQVIVTKTYSQKVASLVIDSINSCIFSESLIDCCVTRLKISENGILNKVKRQAIQTDILFIIPPHLKRKGFLQPPIDALNAAGILIENGYSVDILDLRTSDVPLEFYQIESEIVFVCTCPYDLIQNYPVDYKFEHSISLINYIAASLTTSKVYAYGPYFSINKKAIKKLLYSTVEVIENEIESVVLKIVNDFFNSESILQTDSYFPAYDLVDLSKYYSESNSTEGRISPWCALLGNRGCPYNCSFCYLFFGHRLQVRLASEVVKELKQLENKGVKEVFFIDSTFTASKKWTIEFCELYNANALTIKWQIETRVDCLDDELLYILKNSGCSKVWLGIESLSDVKLQEARKKITVAQILAQVKKIRQSRLPFGAFFIAGLPGETKNSFNELLTTISQLDIHDSQLVLFMPRKGTLYYDLALKQFPFLDEDFRYLQIARGIVNNNIKRSELNSALEDFYKNK